MPIVVPSMLIQRLAPGARKSLQGGGINSTINNWRIPGGSSVYAQKSLQLPTMICCPDLGQSTSSPTVAHAVTSPCTINTKYEPNFSPLEAKGSLHSPCGSPVIFAISHLCLSYMLRPKCNRIIEQKGKVTI